MAKSQVFFVIGLGRFGKALCSRLAELGQYVIAADKSMSRVEEIAPEVAYAVCLDGADSKALEDAGIRQADVAVVAIGEARDSSILCTATLRELGVPRVIARAQTAIHARVLTRVGATRVVFPERDLGSRLAEQISNHWLASFYQLGAGYSVAPLAPLPEMVGKSLSELSFRENFQSSLLLIQRDGQQYFPGPETVIQEEDLLYVVGVSDKLTQWAASLKKREGDE